MGFLRFWRGLECLTVENEWLSRTGVIKLCVIGNEILVLCEDRNLYHANLENSSNTLKFQKISDINAIDIASNNRHLYYVDTFGQVFKCEPKSWELKEEIVIREDARNCLHGHKTPSHRVKIKSVVGGEFGILYISKCGQLWASGSMPQLSINSSEPEKVLFFEGRTVYQAAVGDKFGMVIVRKKICKDETDSENDEDVFTSSCLECQSATRMSSPSQVSLVGTGPLSTEVCKSSEDTSSTSAAHTHPDLHGAHTLTEDTSPSTEDSELTKIHFDENKKAIFTPNRDNSDEKTKSTLESVNEENSNVLTRELSVEDKPNMIFINTEAAKQFLTKQLSWVSAGEDYLVECTERPTRIIKENVSNLTNLVVEGVKTVGDKVATLSRHMSGSSETNDPLEAYQNLIAEELNPLMYSLTSNYKMDEIQMSSSTMSDKEHSQNIIHDRAKMLVKIGQNLLNSEIWVWGDANNGQLGTGDTVKRSQPITVPRLANLGIHKISCGKSHCAAITLDGRVFCWGHNGWHQVSTDSLDDKSSPQQFSANSNTDRARDLACGDHHTMVFTLDENLFFIGKYNTGFTQDAKNLKESIIDKNSLVIEQDFQKKSAKLSNRSTKKHQDFYSTLSADLNFNSHVLSSGILSLYRPQQYGQQETPAFQDLAIEQQFLEEMILVHQSLIRPLLKMTASIASNSSVFETLCSIYADIMYFTALNVLSFWKYTEGYKKATEIALIQNCDEHISLYEKYLNAVCNIIVINGFNVITSYLDVPAALNNLFNDKLPSSKQKNNKTISEGIIFCAILHPLSRLNTYKCMIQSLIKYNSGISPTDVKVLIEQKLVDVLSKWDSFNNSQEKRKNEANITKVFWEGTGKPLEVFRSPERRLVRESKMNPLSLLHSGRFSSHWFILLSDVLIHVNGSTQNIHHLITLWVEPINDTDALQNAIRLITPEESFTVIAPTSQEKFRWLLDFQSAIKSSLNKSSSVNPPLVRTAIYTYTNKSQLYKDAVYSGRWLNGKLHGTGKMEWQDGRMYLGHFHNNQIHGQGRMELPSIGVYEGQWKDNLQNGFGVMKYSSGDIYEGYFKDGLAHGHGVRKQGDFTTSTATIYMGEWNQGVRQGYGVMDDIGKGEKYLGSWSDNKKNGCGLIVTLDGIYYEGVFMNDTLTGHGVMIFEDGTHYEGEFRSAGVFNGKGTLTFSSGDCIDGTFHGAWTDGVKINTGTLQMNVSNPAPPANSIPNSFGQLSVSPNQKWNGLFHHCFEQLGFPDNLLSAMVDQTLKLNNCFWNEKCWRNIAVVLSNAQDENIHTSSISMDMSKRSDNKSGSSEKLDFIPKFGQTSLTMESYNEIKQYVSKACEVNAHPIGQLVSGCAAAFSASYGGVRVHPLLLSHSVVELKCLSVRIYSAVRLLFPALPPPDRHVVLRDGNEDEELNNDEVVSVSGIVQPLLLPRVHPSLHVLYALHHQKEDVTYWKRLLKWNRQTDVTLMAFLGIDQKFVVSYTAKTSVGSPPFSPVKDQLFSEAVDTLQQLKTTFCPMEKLLVIKSTFQKITFAVQKELGPTYLWTMDELFPVFHFVVVRARILQLGSEIHFIEDFLEPCMQNGELGIMFTTLKACYFQILQEKVTICD